jgi:hypothetical protein
VETVFSAAVVVALTAVLFVGWRGRPPSDRGTEPTTEPMPTELIADTGLPVPPPESGLRPASLEAAPEWGRVYVYEGGPLIEGSDPAHSRTLELARTHGRMMSALGWERRPTASFPFGQVWDRGPQTVVVHYGGVRIRGEPEERLGLVVAVIDPSRVRAGRVQAAFHSNVGSVRPPPSDLEPTVPAHDALAAAVALAGVPLEPARPGLAFGLVNGRPAWLVTVPHTCFDAVDAASCGRISILSVVDDQTGGTYQWAAQPEA